MLFTALSQMDSKDRSDAIRAVSAFHWKYPIAKEAEYGRMLSSYLVSAVSDHINLALASLAFRDDRQDASEGYEPSMDALLLFGNSVADFTVGQWVALMEAGVGLAYDAKSPAIVKLIDTWATEQVTLIHKADRDMRDKVWSRVTAGVQNGWLNDTIKDTLLEDMPGISERRAKLIARDQTSKLRAMLSQQCMEDAGFQTYVWSTAGDERVRPSHTVMEGKVCRWDDETVWLEDGAWVPRSADAVHLHPGMDIQCRCIAAVNDAELDELDAADEG